MSILIRGMEMPASCRKCMISQPDGCGWICPIIESKPIVDYRVKSRHQHCPLVTVPPHGRLIDADALVMENYTKYGAIDALALEVIKAAPTIIPESEEVYDKYTDTAGNLHWTGTHSGKHIVKAEEGET